MKFKFYLALYISKLIKNTLHILSKFMKVNGSHLPGNIATKICPNFLSIVSKPKTIIAVTGTNGKTTTSNLIIDALEAKGYKVLNNKTGSNVLGGVTTSLFSGVSLGNKSKFDIAVLEVDEKSTPRIFKYVTPTYLVVTNLFRDSLKRNAHSEYIFDLINKSIPEETTLILNADDLISNKLKAKNSNKKIYFGINELDTDTNESINIVNDARICPICYSKLKYNFVRYHHIGKAYCENCGYKSPEADYIVKKVDYQNNFINVFYDGKEFEYKMVSDSIFNIYNQIAAITVLKQLKIKDKDIKDIFLNMEVTKDRVKIEKIGNYSIINHLAKGQNPVACSIVFKYVKERKTSKEIVLLVEDYHDNKESSENTAWFYDCDFEFLNDESIKRIIVSGVIAKDIEFRLLLAGVSKEKIVALKDENEVAEKLSYNEENEIFILYDMYQSKAVDKVNSDIKRKIEKITK
ncbi:MAG: DUF1727 domain-containing protein [Clostridia bacterium]|nr:DUF1727 domain-containing protein [Clostridia bacterium]